MSYQAGLIPPHICVCHSPNLGKPLAYGMAICALNDLSFNILVELLIMTV